MRWMKNMKLKLMLCTLEERWNMRYEKQEKGHSMMENSMEWIFKMQLLKIFKNKFWNQRQKIKDLKKNIKM